MTGVAVFVLGAVLIATSACAVSASAGAGPRSLSELPPPELGLIRVGGKARGADKSFWLSTFPASVDEARFYCNSQGYELLTIRSNTRQAQILKEYRDYWGVYAPDWVWLNIYKSLYGYAYEDGKSAFFTNFAGSNANQYGDCNVLLGPNGVNGRDQYTWYPVDCLQTSKFVCEERVN